MAEGNLGKYLTLESNSTNIYISRDGGFSWEEVMKGSYVFGVSYHGSLIVMAGKGWETNYILFSWDLGLTWDTQKISETRINIIEILALPSGNDNGTGALFILKGESIVGYNKVGILVSLDFTELLPKTCSGRENPEQADSDYEYWRR